MLLAVPTPLALMGLLRKGESSRKRYATPAHPIDVRVDKFRIRDPLRKPDKVDAAWTNDDGAGKSQSLKSSSIKYSLGNLAKIQARSDSCPICKLVYQSTIDDPDVKVEEEDKMSTMCYADWEVDGREVLLDVCGRIMTHHNLTRRIHLSWSSDKLQDAYLVYVTPTRSVRPNSDAPRSWEREHLFLGRPLEALGKSQALINSWLEACDERHGERCCVSHDGKFGELIEKSYSGFIDVLGMCLVPLPRGEKYVALSYVWGRKKRFRTLLQNMLLHRAHGALGAFLEDLPQAITDAIDVVRRLKRQYLWVSIGQATCNVKNQCADLRVRWTVYALFKTVSAAGN